MAEPPPAAPPRFSESGKPRPDSQLFTADLIFPVCAAAIPNGGIWIRSGMIAAVGPLNEIEPLIPPGEPGERRHFGGGALIPGFVNAHAHLELSAMAGQLPRPADVGEEFVQWIRRLLTIREGWGPADLDASARLGARLLLEGGATTVGDITSSGLSLNPIVDSGLRAVIFREVLGFGADREAAAAATCGEWLSGVREAGARSSGRVTLGLSPHAPHSTSPGIYRECARLAQKTGCYLATHVSETPEELEMIQSGGGPFGRLLTARQHSMEGWAPPGVSPVRYLHDLGILQIPGVAIHVNYPRTGDLELLASGRLAPVFCPQSHRFFLHADHPASAMLDAGLRLALGTDSLASNDNLEMLQEMRLARRLFPATPASRWLECATLGGARALGMDRITGSLEPGKSADIAVIALAGERGPGADPADCLLAAGSHAAGTMVEGAWLVEPDAR